MNLAKERKMTVNEAFVVILDFVNTIFILLSSVGRVTKWKVLPQNLANVRESFNRICFGAKFHSRPTVRKGFIDHFNLQTALHLPVCTTQCYYKCTHDTHKGETT